MRLFCLWRRAGESDLWSCECCASLYVGSWSPTSRLWFLSAGMIAFSSLGLCGDERFEGEIVDSIPRYVRD